MKKNYLPTKCELCPRRCGANRRLGERGICGADDNLKVAHADLHFWEEPPLSGDNVDYGGSFVISNDACDRRGSGTIFFSNCPLSCLYCQNRKISQESYGSNISISHLSNIMLDLQKRGANNINLVTGTHYINEIEISYKNAIERGLKLPIVWNSSGYETPQSICRIAKFTNIWLIDCKYYDNELAFKFSGIKNYFTIFVSALDEILRHVDTLFLGECPTVIVRHLVLPGHASDSCEIVRRLVKIFGSSITLSIMNQYTPLLENCDYPELLMKVSKQEYEEVLNLIDSLGVENYFWQDGETALESFVPNFNLV